MSIIKINEKGSPYIIKGVIFDMDGLMVDTERFHREAKSSVCRQYGVTFTEEDNKEFVGMKDIEESRLIVSRYNIPISPENFAEQKQDAYAKLLQAGVSPKPGLMELVDFLSKQGIIMAIASSSTPSEISTIVGSLGIRHYFSAFCSAEEVSSGKPAPDLFLFAANKLKLSPEDLLVLEDAPRGIEAAIIAGIISLAVPSKETENIVFPESDLFLGKKDNLFEVISYLS